MYKVLKKEMYRYYKYGNEPNVSYVGTTTNTNGVVSGFSSSNYLTLAKRFAPDSSPWELVVKFTTGAQTSAVKPIVGPKAIYKSFYLQVNGTKLLTTISTNGTKYDLGQEVTIATVAANTTYWVKMEFTGSAYNFYVSTDGQNYDLGLTIESSSAIYQGSDYDVILGAGFGSSSYVFNGSIDFNECYIKVNGELWWNGTKAEFATKDDYDFVKEGGYTVATRYYKTTTTSWTQPVLTSNGTMGGNSFACEMIDSAYNYNGGQAYNLFDNNNSSVCQFFSQNSKLDWHWVTFYNPEPLTISSIKVTDTDALLAAWVGAWQLQGSDDNSSWVTLTSGENTSQSGSWTLTVPEVNRASYKYHKFLMKGFSSYGYTLTVCELDITADVTTTVESTKDDYDYSETVNTSVSNCYALPQLKYYKYTTGKWEQPVITQNGTMGGDYFACDQSNYYEASTEVPQKAHWLFSPTEWGGEEWQINSVKTTSWYWATFYNPTPIKIKSVDGMNTADANGQYSPQAWELQGSDDNSTWTSLATGTNDNVEGFGIWTMTIPEENQAFYKYHKLLVQPRSTTAVIIKRLYVDAISDYVVAEGTEENHDFSKTVYTVYKE